MSSNDQLRAHLAHGLSLDERETRAGLWEANSDQRERLADERERLADERELLADSRERTADRHEFELDRREADQAQMPLGAGNTASEPAAALAAVKRAEDGLRRAQARLRQAPQASDRVEAAACRRAAAETRAGASDEDSDRDSEERAWRADRRDFVAVDRDRIAGIRDAVADERDEDAAVRERAADERELAGLDRERHLDRLGTPPRGAPAALPATDHESLRDQRLRAERQRDDAAASRRSAATERDRAAMSWGPQMYGPMLLASFADLAKQLITSDDLGDVLPQVLKYSVGAVDGCEHASVTLVHGGRSLDTVATSPVAAELDDLAFGTGLGPGPEALRGDTPIYVPDLVASRRWPVLSAAAAQLEVASVLCLGLFAYQPAPWTPLGTLTLYGTTRDGYTDEDQEFASILAAYVAVAVAIAQRRGDVDRREAALHRGLSTRDVIGQAKGILMERQHLAAPDAFDLLRHASQSLNVKLADIARHLAETGEMPKRSAD